MAQALWLELFPAEEGRHKDPENQRRLGKIAAAIAAQHNWFLEYLGGALLAGLGEETDPVERETIEALVEALPLLKWEAHEDS